MSVSRLFNASVELWLDSDFIRSAPCKIGQLVESESQFEEVEVHQSNMQKQAFEIMVEFYSLLWILAAVPIVFAQTETCVSLAQSRTCAAFNQSSVSTDSFMVGLYPFLEGVTNSASFDRNLTAYLQEGYINLKFGTLFGCSSINTSNATNLYARFTTTVICNGVVQNSISRCGLTASNSRPVCADSCAQYALSEQMIVADSELCTSPSNYTNSQLRADYTNCGLPDDALVGSDCIEGRTNEPTNCGFGNATIGLCQYCKDTPNDSCCSSSARISERCANVVLPSISVNTTAFLTATATGPSSQSSSTPTGTASSSSDSTRRDKQSNNGLSGGAIAGIVIGAVAGVALLLALLFACCCYRRRKNQADKRKSHKGGKALIAAPMDYNPDTSQMSSLRSSRSEFEVLPGGRLARKSALPLSYSVPPSAPVGKSDAGQEDPSAFQQLPPFSERSFDGGLSKFLEVPPRSVTGPDAAFVVLPGGRKFRTSVTSQSIASDSSPVSSISDKTETLPHKESAAPTVPQKTYNIFASNLKVAPESRKDESVSSNTDDYMTLPGGRLARKSGVTGSVGGHSTVDTFRSPEQSVKSGSTAKADISRRASKGKAPLSSVTKGLTMPPTMSVKDYYTSTDIRPGDIVTAVWSYAARTHDEFTLERGDMLHVTSIWGDGWAIGYLVTQGIDASTEKNAGKKSASVLVDTSNKEVKAFPLVCVCASEYWEKVIAAGGKQLTTLSFDLI